jgi:hypothetical protein
MSHSLSRSFCANADQRSISSTLSQGFPGAYRLSSASIWEGSHQHVRRDFPLAEREWSELKRGLMLTLEMAVAAVVYTGTILAIFPLD